MKKLFSVLLALFLTASLVQAQTMETKGKAKAKGDAPTVNPAMKNGIMMQGGKLMMLDNGVATVVTTDQTLSNGTVVMKDGTVKMADGTSMMMHEGDHMTMEGKMMHHHANRAEDGTAGKSKGKYAKTKMKSTDEKMKIKGNGKDRKINYEK